MTDWERVVAWFRAHPGSSRWEAQSALHGIHVTARMSDARLHGITFDKARDPSNRKVTRFWIREARPPVLVGEQVGMAL